MSMLAAACVLGVASSLSVGVIGAGPGGLALAVALEQKMGERVSVTVFDRSDQLRPALGGGVQLNSGAAVLSRLGLGEEVLRVGHPVRRVLSRNVDSEELLSLDIREALRSSKAANDAGVVQGEKVYAVTMMRDALQDILASRLKSTTLELDSELSDVKLSGEQARCFFADGSTRDFDVVVGADGIGSKVRECIISGGSAESDDNGVYDTRISIQWAVAPAGSRRDNNAEELHQWFAPDGVYCLASTYGGLGGKLYDQV
jgi:salicylate hydroxylase